MFQASQISRGGIEIAGPIATLPPAYQNHHDALARANSLNLGAGVAFRLGESTAVHGSVATTLTGRNTHATKYGITTGLSWTFGGRVPDHPVPTPTR